MPLPTVNQQMGKCSKEEVQNRKGKTNISIVKDVCVVYCSSFLKNLKQPKCPRIGKLISKLLCQLNAILYIAKMMLKKILLHH